MADDPRRSGRATKGQHKNVSSPAPTPKPPKKSKAAKKAAEPEQEEYDNDEERIRCICGNDNPNDKRAFISCEACEVWQHNVCMGMPEEEEDLPEHYFCEQCRPDEHLETIQALEAGEKIWETRNKIWANEKKSSRNRKASKGGQPGWLMKDVDAQVEERQEVPDTATPKDSQGSKRKRSEVKHEERPSESDGAATAQDSKRSARQDKRQKSTAGDEKAADSEATLVPIGELPLNRRKLALALKDIVRDDLKERVQSGEFAIPEGESAESLSEHYASLLEHALTVNHGGPSNPSYTVQYRRLHANLKKNKALIARLLDGSLKPDELSTMNSEDMASDELRKERAVMKEALDRQNVALEVEGPKYRHTHKGHELIEDENAQFSSVTAQHPVAPVRERTRAGEEDGAGSPSTEQQAGSPMQIDTSTLSSTDQRAPSLDHRRQSSQQFDINNIWAKTAQSPTNATAQRPMQMPPRRRSSQPRQEKPDGTTEDADVDRMLKDDYDETTYSPADYTGDDAVVWRGKLVQSADSVSPTVNARYVAGRDLRETIQWTELLSDKLSIDGRLQVGKAEEYLCSLQYSQHSDVSILSFTPYDDAEGFEAIFAYFKSRSRYAVVNKDKPSLVKDLYIIPVDAGQELPSHVGLLEYNRLGEKAPEKCLLATFVVGRAAATTPTASQQNATELAATQQNPPPPSNGQQSLPQHLRPSIPGPAASPLNSSTATFSPGPTTGSGSGSAFPPNPYAPPAPTLNTNPLVTEILGSLQYAPTAQDVVNAEPGITREKLEHLKRILDEDPETRTDLGALGRKLFAGS